MRERVELGEDRHLLRRSHIRENHSPMGAGLVQAADLAAAISKYNKILTQEPQRDRQVLELRLDHDRMPVAPQILTTGGARPDLGQRTRLERRRPIVISAVAAGAALPRVVVHRMIPPLAFVGWAHTALNPSEKRLGDGMRLLAL